MEINTLPNEILFNGWKHHKQFILSQIRSFTKIKNGEEELKKELATIGKSVTDLYYGDLTPTQIGQEIADNLKKLKILNFQTYYDWLNQNLKYRLISLSDGSSWTLTLGTKESKYVHIHPSRFSPFTIRLKAITLKTIISTLFLSEKNQEKISTALINRARKELLHESPIKNFEEKDGLGKHIKCFIP